MGEKEGEIVQGKIAATLENNARIPPLPGMKKARENQDRGTGMSSFRSGGRSGRGKEREKREFGQRRVETNGRVNARIKNQDGNAGVRGHLPARFLMLGDLVEGVGGKAKLGGLPSFRRGSRETTKGRECWYSLFGIQYRKNRCKVRKKLISEVLWGGVSGEWGVGWKGKVRALSWGKKENWEEKKRNDQLKIKKEGRKENGGERKGKNRRRSVFMWINK